MGETFRWNSLRRQWQLILFATLVAAVNVALFVARAVDFVGMRNLWDDSQNFFYMFSRACGTVDSAYFNTIGVLSI